MRHLIAIALAPLAVAACGGGAGAPDEETASTSAAVTTCRPGYHWQCDPMPGGREICGCVANPLECNFVTHPADPGYQAWVESWAVETSDGWCPDIAASGGTWKQLDPSFAGRPPLRCVVSSSLVSPAFDGVPEEYLNGVSVHQCKEVYPSGSCCTYVWWPTDFPEQTTPCPTPTFTGGAVANPQALCTKWGQTFVALEQETCVETVGGPGCPAPGGGTCGVCSTL